MERQQCTEFAVNISQRPKRVTLFLNGKRQALREVTTAKDFTEATDVFFYDERPEMNLWSTPGSDMSRLSVIHSPRLYVCAAQHDITATALRLVIDGCQVDTSNPLLKSQQPLGDSRPTLNLDSWEDGCISPEAYAMPLTWTPVEGADYYEVETAGLLFSLLRQPAFTIEGLTPDTNYEVRVRAVNAQGAGSWTYDRLRTSPDPLRHAIRGITATASIADQPGLGIKHLFDFDEGTPWHTKWDSPNATPFDIIIDLHSVNQLDKLVYVPRSDAGNGTITTGTIALSLDKQTWSLPQTFTWPVDGTPKEVPLSGASARYLHLHVEEARGGFGSGQQIYVFRTEGSEWYIPGDINNDRRLDENDFTSYMNYTGLRRGDGDFEGYVSGGDINGNGLIDAFDISHVAIELEDGITSTDTSDIGGTITVTPDKRRLAPGEVVTLTVAGHSLSGVNAISFALPYDATVLEYVATEPVGMKEMRNMTYDRLHTNGQKALYPTFVNCGEHPCLDPDAQLMLIRFRAKKATNVDLTPIDAIIVDKHLSATCPTTK